MESSFREIASPSLCWTWMSGGIATQPDRKPTHTTASAKPKIIFFIFGFGSGDFGQTRTASTWPHIVARPVGPGNGEQVGHTLLRFPQIILNPSPSLFVIEQET